MNVSSYSDTSSIWSWLEALDPRHDATAGTTAFDPITKRDTDHDDEIPDSASASAPQRPRKRARVDECASPHPAKASRTRQARRGSGRPQLPSPSRSRSESPPRKARGRRAMASSPPKRRQMAAAGASLADDPETTAGDGDNDDAQDMADHHTPDHTPRPLRTSTTTSAPGPPPPSLPPGTRGIFYTTPTGRSAISLSSNDTATTNSVASSRGGGGHSKTSRSSSPRKRRLEADFYTCGDFDDPGEVVPPTLVALCRDLHRVANGVGVLPGRLRDKFTHSRFPPDDRIFEDNDFTSRIRLPDHDEVTHYQRAASMHDAQLCLEEQWNAEVHQPLMNLALTVGNRSGLLKPHKCNVHTVLPDFSLGPFSDVMVDYGLFLEPPAHADQRALRRAARHRPGQSINHSAKEGIISHCPMAVSIETKRHGEHYDKAFLQLASWHAAQWRSILWCPPHGVGRGAGDDGRLYQMQRDASTLRIEFLAGIIVQGHDWSFFATTLGVDEWTDERNKPRVLRPGIPLGDTRTVLGTYRLLAALQRVGRWAEEEFWPAFKADMVDRGEVP